jgi:hypothetical protein
LGEKPAAIRRKQRIGSFEQSRASVNHVVRGIAESRVHPQGDRRADLAGGDCLRKSPEELRCVESAEAAVGGNLLS